MQSVRYISLFWLSILIAGISSYCAQDTLDAQATAGSNNQWSDSTNCASLDDNDANTATRNRRLEVQIENSGDSGSINWVKVRLAIWMLEYPGFGPWGGSDGGIRVGLRTNGVWDTGSAQQANDQEAYVDDTWTTKPQGGNWTWTDINNLDAGGNSHQYFKARWQQLVWYVDHVQIIVDYNAYPDITGLSASSNATGEQIDSQTVKIYYEVNHVDDNAVFISARYREGGTGSWTDLTDITVDTGYVDANSQSTDRIISWDIASQLGSGKDNTFEVRVIAVDTNHTSQKDSVVTASFNIDTDDPTGLANLSVTNVGQDSVSLQWTQASDTHFDHYEIWYGTDSADVALRYVNMSEWDENDDANLSSSSTNTTTIKGLSILTEYYFKIWAQDEMGNEMTTASVCTTTLTTAIPQVTGWDPSADVNSEQYDKDNVRIGYEVFDADDSTANITLEMKFKNAATWTSWSGMKPYISGDTGWVYTDQTCNDTMIWNARSQLGSIDTTAFVRILSRDSSDNRDTCMSIEFIIDTENPVFTATLNTGTTTSSTVPLTWTGTASDDHFHHYEIWYGTSQSEVENRGVAAEWDNDPNDPDLTTASTTSTTITGLLANTTYYFRIWAVDNYGNETYRPTVSAITATSTTLEILDIQDNTIVSTGNSRNYNYGASVDWGSATVGRFFSFSDWNYHRVRTLVKINLGSLPIGATVDTAYFTATCHTTSNYNSRTINCRQVLVDWVEGDANGSIESGSSCWNYRMYASQSWNTAGCDQDDTDRGSSVLTSVGVTGANTYSWGSTVFTQLVQNWHTGITANYGLLFESEASAEANYEFKEFYSAEHQGSQPKLMVLYHFDEPVVSGLFDSSYITASQDDRDTATIKYELSDENHDSAYITAEYKPIDGTWTMVTNCTGDVNDSVYAGSAGTDRIIKWNVRAQLGDAIDGSYISRVISIDPWGLGDTTQSDTFGIDTKDPYGLSNFSVTDSFSFWLECSWDAVSQEGHFNHYEIWYGSNKNDVENRTGTALVWDGDDNNGMNEIATDIMKVKFLSSSTKYYLKIWAVDDMGNETTVALDSATTLDDPIPTVTGWEQTATVNAGQTDAQTVRIGYMIVDIDSDTAHAKFEFRRYDGSWTTPTAMYTSGDTGDVATGEGVNDTILWNVYSDPLISTSEDTLYYVRVISLDDSSFSDTTISDAFFIDFVAPAGMSNLSISNIDANSATLTWTAANDETQFSHYEIWYGTTLAHVQGRSGTANEWDHDNDAGLSSLATSTTTITSLLPSQTYYFKIWAVDAINNESTITYVSDATGASNDPVVTGPGGAALVAAGQTSTSSVTIDYDVSDANSPTLAISAEYQVYGSTGWTALTTASGDIGAAVTVGTGKQIIWGASTDLPADGAPRDSAYRVRVTADDAGTRAVHSATSDTFTLDVQAPVGLGNFTATDTLGTEITFTWSAAADRNFDHYEIWYGSTQGAVEGRTGNEWDEDNDAALATKTTNTTVVNGLTVNSTYWWKIWAVDNIGNEATIASAVNINTKNMATPVWSKTGLGTIKGGAITESVIYIGSGSGVYKLNCINCSNGALKWSYSTAAYGACNNPTYVYNNGNYKIVASAGNYIIGRQDNGTSSSQLFTPVNLGAPAGNPYISPDENAFYVVYDGKLTKRDIADGSEIWTVSITNVSTSADMVVFDDVVYVAASDGMVYKRNTSDGTANQSYNARNEISLPLLIQNGTLYITPDSDTAYAINSANMTVETWKLSLSDNNTGEAFIANGESELYLAVSDSVVEVNSGTGVRQWAYDAGSTVSSGPIPYEGYIYFSCDNGLYFTIDNTGTNVNLWPYSGAGGSANVGPWIDANGKVLFGTSNGNLDAFSLESTRKNSDTFNSDLKNKNSAQEIKEEHSE